MDGLQLLLTYGDNSNRGTTHINQNLYKKAKPDVMKKLERTIVRTSKEVSEIYDQFLRFGKKLHYLILIKNFAAKHTLNLMHKK